VAFTPATRARIKQHLGYPSLTGVELLNHGMLPFGATELLYSVEGQLDRVQEAAEFLVLKQLERIDCVEKQILESYGNQVIGSVGGVVFNGLASIVATNHAYVLETDKLADMLGVQKNPASALHRRIGGTGEGSVIEPG
jgi:hypothetical protein